MHRPLELVVEAEQLGDLAHVRRAASRRSRRADGQRRGRSTRSRRASAGGGRRAGSARRSRRRRQREVLERAADPEPRDPVRAQRVDPRVAVADLAGGGAADAGEHVQARGLAGAVGADDRVRRAGLDVERDVAQRGEAAEADGDVASAQRPCAALRRGAAAGRRGGPRAADAEVAAADLVAGRQLGPPRPPA